MTIPFPEIRHSGDLPPSLEALAEWEDGRIVVYVTPGLSEEDEIRVAVRAAATLRRAGRPRRRDAVLIPIAALGARLHSGTGMAATAAVTAAAGTAAVVALGLTPAASGPHQARPGSPAGTSPAAALTQLRASGDHGSHVTHTGQRRRGGATDGGSAGSPRPATPGTVTAPVTPPAPPGRGSLPPLPAPVPSVPSPRVSTPGLPHLPLPHPTVTVPLPSQVPVPPVVKKVTHLVCHLNILGVKVCVRV